MTGPGWPGILAATLPGAQLPAPRPAVLVGIVDSFVGDTPSAETLLLVVSVLLGLGYLGMRLSSRFRIPVVTAFLLLGLGLGPSGLSLVSPPIIDSLRLIEPIALGLITFSAGEQLFVRDLRNLSKRSFAAIALETVLPIMLVFGGVFMLTGRAEIALPLSAIAGTTGIATVVATLREHGAKGNFSRTLSAAIATDNVFAILFFSLTLPVAIALEEAGDISALYIDSLASLIASIAIGGGTGLVLARFIRQIRSSSELSMFVLAFLLIAVSVTNILGYSVLLAGLAMGITAANLSGGSTERERLFSSLGPLETPLISVFFLWAGASLHVEALTSVGAIALVYLGARAAGKWIGPALASLGMDGGAPKAREIRMLGIALLPQAGAAIGLAIRSRDFLPIAGDEILTVVLASVVIFEVTGPLAIQRAVRAVGEVTETKKDEPMTLPEAVRRLEERRGVVMVVTDHTTTLWQVASTISLADRLHTDLLLLPVHEPEPNGTQNQAHTSAPQQNTVSSEDAVSLLRRYAARHDHQLRVLPTCTGAVVECVAEVADLHQTDLLILAWGPAYRHMYAADAVEIVGCPVVELTEPKYQTERRSGEPRSLASRIASAGMQSHLGRFLRRLQGPVEEEAEEDERRAEDDEDHAKPPSEGG